MDCKTIRKHLVDYLLEELDPKQEIRISEHLVHCSSCRHEANALEKLFFSIKEEKPIAPPSRVFDRIRTQTGIGATLTPFSLLRKPIRLYHAFATLILGIVLALLSNALIERHTYESETVRTPYRAIQEPAPSDSITFYTAPSHRIGGT